MIIEFPDFAVGKWQSTPIWLVWKGLIRRRHWRWTVDHRGCVLTFYWQYDY